MWLQLAELYLFTRDVSDAMHCVEQARASAGSWSLPLNIMHARVLQASGRLDSAVEIMDAVLAIQPDCSSASSLLGEFKSLSCFILVRNPAAVQALFVF